METSCEADCVDLTRNVHYAKAKKTQGHLCFHSPGFHPSPPLLHSNSAPLILNTLKNITYSISFFKKTKQAQLQVSLFRYTGSYYGENKGEIAFKERGRF